MNGRGFVLMLALALQACGASAPTDRQTGPADPPAASTSSGKTMASEHETDAAANAGDAPVKQLQPQLKEGLAYADFRKLVLGAGWVPVVDPQCRANVIGADHETLCAENPGLALCKACDNLPELSACSSDGYCTMQFSHPQSAQTLRAIGYGMTEDWNVSGEDSRFELSSWEFPDTKK